MSNTNNGASVTNSRYGPHPVKKSSRTAGIVMAVAAFIALIVSFFVSKAEKEKFLELVMHFDPNYNFINPENIGGSLSVVAIIQGGIVIVLVLGLYRIIYSRKSTTVFAIVSSMICMFLTIFSGVFMQGPYKEVKSELLSNQHTWAEERYGITYDEITVRKVENGKRDYKAQDKVLLKGEVIASVCDREYRQTVVFCETGTDTELPVISQMDEETTTDEKTYVDSLYDETTSDEYSYDEYSSEESY